MPPTPIRLGRASCAIVKSLPGAYEDWPWGSIHCKVDGKIFAGWDRDDEGVMVLGIQPMELDSAQLCEFSERGYVVIPGVVPAVLIEGAKHAIARLLAEDPPLAGHRGGHNYWLKPIPCPLLDPLMKSDAFELAASLIRPAEMEAPESLQVALNIPWNTHHPGGPHIDGLTPPERDMRPGTFTLLAGIFLTDQMQMEMGNVWVWPGTHRSVAAYLRERGADALMEAAVRYPPVELPAPVAVLGRSGDLLLAHYLCGHNSSGNESEQMRQVLYFRLRSAGHRGRWRQCVTDPLLEFAPVRD